MTAGTESNITFRRLEFEFPNGLDPLIIPGDPEGSYFNVGVSLLLPHLEPYLIRSMNQAKPHVTDARISSELALFNAQEGQHYRQHTRFNEALQLAGFEDLKPLEAELAEDYQRFTTERSLRFNLAYAEGFEAFTMAMARFSFEIRVTERMLSPVRELFEWHLVEELEHRTVAFDVYMHVYGGYFYRLFVGLFAQWHLMRFALRAAARIKAANRAGPAQQRGGAAARRHARRMLASLLRLLLPKVLASFLPWYDPHRIQMPIAAQALGRRFSEMAAAQAAARESSLG